MRIIDLKKGLRVDRAEGEICLVLGNFDGVHLGHAALIEKAVAEKKIRGTKVAVWTFEEHPMKLLSGGICTLTENGEKNRIFAEKGVDYAVYEDFCAVKDMTPDEFVENILIGLFDCKTAVCGFNYRFGKNGKGDVNKLTEIMEGFGRMVIAVEPVCKDGEVISSTLVRQCIESGRAEKAAELLGRPYSIELPVVHGKELGRKLGFPTINQVFPADRIIPEKGIYASRCTVNDKLFYGVSNVGTRPTVNGNAGDVNCETHIIGFDGWLYDCKVKVEFCKKLRDEVRFENVELLTAAVKKDIENALSYFSKKEFEKK